MCTKGVSTIYLASNEMEKYRQLLLKKLECYTDSKTTSELSLWPISELEDLYMSIVKNDVLYSFTIKKIED